MSDDPKRTPALGKSNPTQPLFWFVATLVVLVFAALFRASNDERGTLRKQQAARTQVDSGGARSKKQAIRSALDKRIGVDYQSRPLAECLRDVARQIAIPLHIDRVALTQEGVDLDEPVTMHFRDLSARSVFQLLLERLMLTYSIRDEVLVITTSAQYRAELETRAYDVTDLVVTSGAGVVPEADFAPLIDLIKSAFWREFREDAVPLPAIEAFSANGVNSLVVRQDAVTLAEIGALLVELKAERHREMAAIRARPKPSKSESPRPPANAESAAGRTTRFDSVVRGNNEFALELYSQLARDGNGNLFFSPYSVSSAMAMVYAGAKQETAREIAATMHYLPWPERVPAVFRGLTSAVTQPAGATGRSRGPSLGVTVSNRVWFQNGIEVDAAFRQTLAKDFGAEPMLVDFAEQVRVAGEINRRIEEDTQGLVKELVRPEQFDIRTRFVLTNAVGFGGAWTRPFHESRTTPGLFETPDGFADVPIMSLVDHCGYVEIRDDDADSPDLQILEKPYGNGELSMVILLPGRGGSKLSGIEQQLTERRLAEWLAPLEQRQVEVLLPKFHLESGFDLGESLRKLGVQQAFVSPGADFSGILSKEPLMLAAVVHKAVVDVNEHGTRAAGASELSGYFGARDPIFQATTPFIFLIRDNRTGCILFIGRLVRPKS